MFSCLCEPCCGGCAHGCCGCDCSCHHLWENLPPLDVESLGVKAIITRKMISPIEERGRRLGELLGKAMARVSRKQFKEALKEVYEEPASE